MGNFAVSIVVENDFCDCLATECSIFYGMVTKGHFPCINEFKVLININAVVANSMSATGHVVPPIFTSGRKRMKTELLDRAPAGLIGMTSDSRCINTDLFLIRLVMSKIILSLLKS